MAIDYQVGDIVTPKAEQYSWVKAEVIDITEKYLALLFLGDVNRALKHYPIYDIEMWKKDRTGTLLYGNKEKQHSKG